MKGIYKFNWDCGRMGNVESIFIATNDEIQELIGKTVYFGEILGKHSEVYGKIKTEDLRLISNNQEFVGLFETNDMATGYNPFDYLD